MFVVPGFGPWIGEENEDPRNRGTRWQGIDEESRIGMDEMEVIQLRSIAFAHCASGEKMAVP